MVRDALKKQLARYLRLCNWADEVIFDKRGSKEDFYGNWSKKIDFVPSGFCPLLAKKS